MKKYLTSSLVACCGALGMLAFSGSAGAQIGPFDQTSYMTFSQKVQLPGVTLPAGTYIFRLPDRNGARHVIQILSRDRSVVYAMLPTRPTYRAQAENDPSVLFHKSPSGTPQPIRAWFYAGEKFGLEFAYPKQQAEQIARQSGGPVLTTQLEYVQ